MEGSKQPIINNNNNGINDNNDTSNSMQLDQRKSRPQNKEQALNCPRCNSTNTKFCYYNNYSLTQPRFFCKTCRRYWTKGGSLRNVPVGGGSRKNKRSTSTSTNATSTSIISSPPISLANKKLLIHDIHNHHINPNNTSQSLLPNIPSLNFPLQLDHHQNPKLIHQGQDLNLSYPPTAHDHHHHHHHSITRIPILHHDHLDPYNSSGTANSGLINPSTTDTTTSSSQNVSAMELLKTGMASRGGLSGFMAMPVHSGPAMFLSPPTGFPNVHHEFKPSLSFGFDQYHGHHDHDHHEGGYNINGNINNLHDDDQENSGNNNNSNSARLLFPSSSTSDHQDNLKHVSSSTTNAATTTSTDHHDDHDHRLDRHDHGFEQINRGREDNNSASAGYNWNRMLGGGSW